LEKLRQAAARGEPFSVAVLDWQMPGLDGFALARLIKQDAALRGTGLVLLSSFTQDSQTQDHESSGFAAWLPKPARQSELYDAIIRAANGRLSHIAKTMAPATPSEIMPPRSKGSGTVLLAEDNEINQEVASEMVAEIGYHCVRVRTGREAVAMVQNGAAQLVLMDCQMPEMDGYEATRLIRRWEQQEAPESRRSWRLPIVALTAHAMKGDRARCLEAGMDDYLTKPLEPGELARSLARWMPQRDAAAPEATVIKSGANPAVQSPAGIDFPSLLHRCMGKQDLVRRLIQRFLVQAAADLQELETAIRDQDAARLRLVAHRLKGSSANVSAEAVRENASRLEMLGLDGNLAAAPPLIAQLNSHIETVKNTCSQANLKTGI
jgi:CheY-like chemotaxis protein/HPt (histidine-containing phosphotransfer) domain-containing protein